MNWLKGISARWSIQKKLLSVVAVLMMVVLAPVLCVYLLAPAVCQWDGGGPTAGIGGSIISLVDLDVRDPQEAAKYGILGYVELTWKEAPPELVFSRGATSSATMLAHFVSYSPEITEVNVHLDPSGNGCGWMRMRYGEYYTAEDGSKKIFWFSSLMSYDTGGIIRLKADEIMPIKVTVQIPVDFPEQLEGFWFYPTIGFCFCPTGIAPEDGRIGLLADAVETGWVTVR